MIEINRSAKPNVILIGQEKTPVIIIDDYALCLKQTINYAIEHSKFEADKDTYYPGIRSPLPRDYVIACLKPLMQGLYKIYSIPENLQPNPKDNCFSLITTEPENLSLLQTLPHFDTYNPYFFAVLHYLDKGAHGGTGIFRHIPTHYERISEERSGHYLSAAEDFLAKSKMLPLGYCVTSSDHYELFHQIEYRPNRLVIYPGNLLHSTLVNIDTDLSSNPEEGRLTANMFIEFS